MTTSGVACVECGAASETIEWGFVLLARHGWTARLDDQGREPAWRCPACSARAARETWDLEMEEGDRAGQRPRILLVDHQELVLRATASMLREFDVVTAGSGAEALDRLQRGHFDAVVSDVSMPGMSGPELFVRVCARFPHLAQRFLFLSGDRYGAVPLIAACAARAKIGVVPQLLEKPVPRDALVREIMEITASQQLRSGTYEIPAVSLIDTINAK